MTDLDRITIAAPLKMIILGHEHENNFALQEVYVEPKENNSEKFGENSIIINKSTKDLSCAFA